MWRALVLFLLMSIFAAPSAEAEFYIDRRGADVSSHQIIVASVHRFTGNDTSEIRAHIDEYHGNDDGHVTSAEARRFEEDHRLRYDELKPGCFNEITVARINGSGPRGPATVRQSLLGVEGPVASTDVIGITHATTYAFSSPANSTVRVTINLNGMGVANLNQTCAARNESRPPRGLGEGFDHWGWEFKIFPDNFEGFREVVPIGSAVYPTEGYSIVRGSERPARYDPYWDGRGWVESDSRAPWAGPVTFTVVPGSVAQDAPGAGSTAWRLGLIGLGLAGLLFLAWSREGFQIWFLRWLVLAPGFSRLEKDDVLRNRRREELVQRVREQPGITFTELRDASEIPNGPLVHHLRVLRDGGHLRPLRDGRRIRFYVRQPGMVPSIPKSERESRLLALVSTTPGLTQHEAATRLGCSRLAVRRIARRLSGLGELRIQQDGRHRRYYLARPKGDRTMGAPSA